MTVRRLPGLEAYRDVVLAALMRRLPLDWVSDFGAWMGAREGRRAIVAGRLWVQRLRDNFTHFCGVVDPAELDRLIVAYTAHVGRVYAEVPVLHRLVGEDRVEVVGREHLEGLSRPAILASCHLAHWELVGQVATFLQGGITDLYVPPDNPIHSRLVLQARRAWPTDVELVPASATAMLQLTRALERGRNLLIFVDEEKDSYVWGPRLGRTVPHTGNLWFTARLAVRYQADIVPVHVEVAGKSRYRVVIEPRLLPGTGDIDTRIRALAAQLDGCFDAWIRARPQHWYWLTAFELDKPAPQRGRADAEDTPDDA